MLILFVTSTLLDLFIVPLMSPMKVQKENNVTV